MSDNMDKVKKYNTGDTIKIHGSEDEFEIIGFNYEETKYEDEEGKEIFEVDYWYTLFCKKNKQIYDARNTSIREVVKSFKIQFDADEEIEGEGKLIEYTEEEPEKPNKLEAKIAEMSVAKFTKLETNFMLDEYIKFTSLYEFILPTSPSEAVEYKRKADEIMSILKERGSE